MKPYTFLEAHRPIRDGKLFLIMLITVAGFWFFAIWFGIVIFDNNEERIGADLKTVEIKDNLKLKADKDKIIYEKTIDWIECNGDVCIDKGKIKNYHYISEEKELRKVKFKNGEKYSNTLIIKNDSAGTVYRMFLADRFYQDSKKDVYKIEQKATTTIEAFNEQTKEDLVSKIKSFFINIANAGDEYSSGAGDGNVYYKQSSASWSTVHDATDGSGSYPTIAASYAPYSSLDNSTDRKIDRAFFPIDTSAIGSTDTIISATLSVYFQAKFNEDNDGDDWINVVQTNQSSHTSLGTGDYDECGESDGSGWSNAKETDIIEGATRIDVTGIATDAYTVFTLDATGRGWIARDGEQKPSGKTAGWTHLGLREGHDMLDHAVQEATRSGGFARFSENTTAATRPYLEVTIEAPAVASPPPTAEALFF